MQWNDHVQRIDVGGLNWLVLNWKPEGKKRVEDQGRGGSISLRMTWQRIKLRKRMPRTEKIGERY